MPVTIYCKGFPSWPEKIVITIEDGWTIADTLQHTSITNNRHGIMAIVNGRLSRLSTPLKPDDEVIIYPRMGGG